MVNQYNFARQTVCLECPFSAFIFCLFFFPSGNFQKCVCRDASYSLKVAAQTKQHRGVNAFIHAFFFVLTSFHQYVQCPATEHHREYHDHQNPYQRWKNHKKNTPLSYEGLLQIKEYCFIIRYDMHYGDQSDIVFIYFLSITFHHPNLNYSLGNDTADFHAFPKIFLDLNGPWPKNFT